MSKQNKRLRAFVTIAMLSSISFVLMLFNFPLPGFPSFLQIDFSDVPALIATLTMGPLAGITVELIKNILDWVFSGSPTGMPVGHIANFATGILFIFPVYFIYKKFTSITGLIVGLVAATVVMSVGMAFLNFVAFLPMYGYFMNFYVEDMLGTAVMAILPFNLIKGVMLIVIVTVLFRTMSKWIHNQRLQFLS
ncbi:ECF transporter S component [Lysinibacillus sp. 54212]|uniref:ECF transporter S component n=1 Tax=Lysinibacillus sp. 54212 TaxID=3119829 RepID=UPI002FC92BF7